MSESLNPPVAVSKTETPTRTITPTETIRASECMMVAVAENATTTQTRPEPLNMAKAREALKNAAEAAEEIMEALRQGKKTLAFNTANYIVGIARTALMEPPRNCEKYANHNDAMKAFEAFVREQGKLGFINPYTEAFKWLFAPATKKEGGDK